MDGSVYLLLQTGQLFKGKGFGATGCASGEVVFTTGMTGYVETLTDPAYYGQIVMMTFPLIGNYGVNPSDSENPNSHVSAFIVRDFCDTPSNFRSVSTLNDFLKSKNIIGLYGIDTRQLTKIIRENGVMNALVFGEDSPEAKALTDEKAKAALLAKLAADKTAGGKVAKNAVAAVTRAAPETFAPLPLERTQDESGARIWVPTKPPATVLSQKKRVVLWDFGTKQSLITELCRRGFEVVAMPAASTAQEIAAQKADGVVLSSGPGNPAENGAIIAEIAKVAATKTPIFAVGLGHQLLALSFGAKTEKLKYGHHGGHPVKRAANGKIYVTSQNHGYNVVPASLPDFAHVSFVNVNDGTCEGIDYGEQNAFSVQFYPDGNSSPLDTGFLFDDFIALIQSAKTARSSQCL